MAENPTVRPPPPPPALQKPPGYRDPAAAPPPPPPRRRPLPPAFRHAGKPSPRRRRRRRPLCCYFFLAFLIAALVAGAGAAVAYLWFQPRLPSFRLQTLKPRISVAAGAGAASIDAAAAARLLVSNPNSKIALSFAAGDARVSIVDVGDDDDVAVGETGFLGFEQPVRNWTVVRFETARKGVSVDGETGLMVRKRFKSRTIRFRVVVRTKIRFRVKGKRVGSVPVRVECGPVSLRVAARGDAFSKCPIYLFRWIKLH